MAETSINWKKKKKKEYPRHITTEKKRPVCKESFGHFLSYFVWFDYAISTAQMFMSI